LRFLLADMMIDSMANKILKKFIHSNIIEPGDEEIYLYGLQMMISGIVKFAGFMMIAWVLGWIPEALVFITAFSSLRVYAGGYHADTYLKCFIITAAAAFVSIFIVKAWAEIYMYQFTVVLILAACLMIFRYAPVDSPNKRMVGNERRIFRAKTLRIMFMQVALISVIMFFAPQWMVFCNIAAMAMYFEGMSLLPIFAGE